MSVVEFTLEGLIPSKKNSRVNLPSGISVPSTKYRQWESYARDIAALHWKGEPTSAPVSIRLVVHGLRNDLDNLLGSVMDALKMKRHDGHEGWGVYFDDRQVHVAVVRRVPGSREKKCIVRIGVGDG